MPLQCTGLVDSAGHKNHGSGSWEKFPVWKVKQWLEMNSLEHEWGKEVTEQDGWAEVPFLTVFSVLMQSGQKASKIQGQKLLRLMTNNSSSSCRYSCHPSLWSYPSSPQDKQHPQTGADFSLSEQICDKDFKQVFFWSFRKYCHVLLAFQGSEIWAHGVKGKKEFLFPPSYSDKSIMDWQTKKQNKWCFQLLYKCTCIY